VQKEVYKDKMYICKATIGLILWLSVRDDKEEQHRTREISSKRPDSSGANQWFV